MKRFFETAKTQGTALAAVLVFLVMGSGVSLFHAFAQIA
jgi:hypothetical protein